MKPTIGIVGCGYWGKNLVRNFHEIGALKVVCDTTENGSKTARSIAPDCELVSNAESVFASDVSGIVIATPAETHCRLARQALQAGKHVFVEKPLALSHDDGHSLVELADRLDRILMIGHVLEYHPAILKLRELVSSGTLGKVRYIYSHRLSLGKIRREENILWSFAPHDIAIVLRLLGTSPFEVVACGGSYISANIADVTVTNLLFDNGVRAHIFVSWLNPFKEQRLVVVGSKRMASFDDVSKKLILYDQHVDWTDGAPVPVSKGGEEIPFPGSEPLRNECLAFLEAIENHTPPLTDGRSGLEVLKVLQAAQRSLVMNGNAVALPMAASA
jgi:predicted dehydrogenase